MLANVTSLTDAAGAKVESYKYSAFGKQDNPVSAVGNPFSFAGREWDEKSSTYYNRARQFDPSSGRFTSEDPIPSSNGYPYAGNDPVSSRDPSGLFSLSELGAVNSIRGELAGEQIGFGANLLGLLSGDGVSAGDVAAGAGIAAGASFGAVKLARIIRGIRASSRAPDLARLVEQANVEQANGLSRAAQALDGDFARVGISRPKGSQTEKNDAAAALLDDIVNSPGARWEVPTAGALEGVGHYRIAPDGRGVAFGPHGRLEYFGRFD